MPARKVLTIDEVEKRVSTHETRLNELERCQVITRLWIEGDDANDKPGSRERLRNLEDKFTKIDERLSTLTKTIIGLIVSVLSAVLIYVILNTHPR